MYLTISYTSSQIFYTLNDFNKPYNIQTSQINLEPLKIIKSYGFEI